MRKGLLGTLGVWLTGAGLALAQTAPEFRPARSFSFGPAVAPAVPARPLPVVPAVKAPTPVVRPVSSEVVAGTRLPVGEPWPADALPVSEYEQGFGPPPSPESNGEPLDLGAISETDACGLCDTQRAWATVEYLMWWVQDSPVPVPLATSGPVAGVGALNQPFTQVLIGNGGLESGTRHGGRISVGAWLCDEYAVEVGGFWISQDGFTAVINPGNGAILARPFFDVTTNQESSLLVAGPNQPGSVTVNDVNRLFGAECNVLCGILRQDGHRVNLLAGLRQLTLDDELTIRSVSFFSPPVAIQSLTITDRFLAENRWYGGQVGIQAGIDCGRAMLSSSIKAGFGLNQQRLLVAGQTLASNGNTATGGLLALAGNSLDDSVNEFSFLNEVSFDLAYRVTDWAVVTGGYSFLYLTGVARPGQQIDRAVNPNLVPSQATFSPGASPVRPEQRINQGDFWAHGLHVGLTFRY